MREWEKATWAAGQTEAAVIRRVGEIVARRALQLTEAGDLILIVAGKGHNGDDARCAREHLAERRSELLEVTEPETATPKLKSLLALRPALIIDGLFGIGLNRPLDAGWLQLIRCLNEARAPVLSVDVPSGLDAETGQVQGEAIQASVTLTLGAPKRGLLQSAAWPFVERLEVAPDIGLVPCPCASEIQWTMPDDFMGYPPRRLAASHKGTFGHLAIVAGSMGYHGAAVLAARGAQRAQPGRVTLFTGEPVYQAVASQLQAAMVQPWKSEIKLATEFTAILIGPGLAAPDLPEDMKVSARRLWRGALLPVIVDASALDWLRPDPVPQNAIRVVTPHPGEAARLLKTTVPRVQSDRVSAVRELSRQFGNCWVVLKGHQTVVGRSAGEVFINSSGNPHLAQGGSGDLLAGFLSGLLAQPSLQARPLDAIRYAVWQHGAAADCLQYTQPNWVVEDLAPALGKAAPNSTQHSLPAPAAHTPSPQTACAR
jgi:NAD(P)H-hydrate epimerase